MLENTKRTDTRIEAWTPLTPSKNISKRGEDIGRGQLAVRAGIRLKPHHLGLIAALGIVEVTVVEKPKIAILATGNELVRIGNKLQENQIFEVNSVVLSALCHELGAETIDLGLAKDNGGEITGKLRFGLNQADMLITTGGTSVGVSDLVPDAINRTGRPGVIVHGVAVRPGMPTALAVADGKPIVALSGNPVAAMIGFEVFAKPLICRMLELKQEELRPMVTARITRRITKPLGRRTFLRTRVFKRNGEFFAEPVSTHGSGIISTVTKANGYVIVPENREGLEEGESATVYLFDGLQAAEENVQKAPHTG
jgi:molybdenum cofactor synthesis domain-containing protein